MKKVFLKYLAEKIDELLTKADEQMATKSDLAKKVDKVDGKGLSTNDYTTAEKAKLAGIHEGAQRNTVTSVRGAFELNKQVGDVIITAAGIGLGDANQRLTSLEDNVDTLQGTDSGKSVRTIAAEETAKIVGNAPANYDTLKEIADYIASDATGAAEMSNKINKNATDIATLQSTKASKTEAQGYATTAKNEAITAAATDAQNKANTAENNAKTYADSNKLGKNEKAADSAKADSASALIPKSTTVTSVYNISLTYHLVLADDVGSLPRGDNANAVITIPTLAGNLKYLHQLGFTRKGLFHRKFYNKDVDTTTPWSQIAFIDSTVANAEKLGGVASTNYMQKSGGTFTGSITAPTFIGALQGDADSAAKLATPRTIWGQSFDGSGNVNGDFKQSLTSSTGNVLTTWLRTTALDTNYGLFEILAKTTASSADKDNYYTSLIAINAKTKNVGIGTTNPTEKLDVAGNIKASGMLTTGSDAEVGGAIDVEGGITSRGDIDASGNNIKGNLDGTIKAVMRNTNLFLLGFAQEAGAAAKPYVTTQVSVNNGVLTIKGLRVEGDVEITGNTVFGGRITSAASYQSSPISTTSEEGVPTTEEQLRAQISTLEERIEALERLIAQNNG